MKRKVTIGVCVRNCEDLIKGAIKSIINPLESIYVDDNPLKGFVVAKKLGIHIVRVLRDEYKDVKADKRYETAFEIRNLDNFLM